MHHHTRVLLDLGAFKANIALIKSLLPESCRYCAVVKGDAYGHGLDYMVPAASSAGVYSFGIVDNREAARIRELGLTEKIIRLRPSTYEEAVQATVWGVEELCGCVDDARMLSEIGRVTQFKVPVHLKLDVGMGRMGFSDNSEDGIVEQIISHVLPLDGINVVGVCTHFPCADEEDLSVSLGQKQSFEYLFKQIKTHLPDKTYKHIANSAASLRMDMQGYGMTRVGLAAYGLCVGEGAYFSEHLEPVMHWETRVVQVRHVPKGATVGYGMTYTCQKDSVLATLPLGYADGYPRTLSNQSDVIIHGKRCPVVGRVSMNLLIIDVSALDKIDPGDNVILIGKQGNESITLDELADKAGLLNYELACLIGKCNYIHVVAES